MKQYSKQALVGLLAIVTLVAIGCSSTRAKDSSNEQSNVPSSQSTSGATPVAETLEGCIFQRQTEIYLEPADGSAATKISSSGKDVSSNVGQNVRLSGNSSSSSGSSSGNVSGSRTGTSGEPEFVVTRVDVVAKECPSDIQSRVDRDKKSKK